MKQTLAAMADTQWNIEHLLATAVAYMRDVGMPNEADAIIELQRRAATPPADAALADELDILAENQYKAFGTIKTPTLLRKAAAALRARAVPEGFVMVPVEPTEHMIEEGAKSIASWENGSIWPDSWGAMAHQLRKDARTAYVSMVSESPERSNSLCEWVLTKDKDWQPSCTEEWARFKIIPSSQQCPQCGCNISAILASQSATGGA